MPDWLYIIVSVVIAAFVGGVTNHFAIKMLFHPRRPIKIGSWHVPFTPGLIPKRHEDIAVSLGEVVADYLVTAEGLTEMTSRPEFQTQVEEKLRGLLSRWEHSDMTVKDVMLRAGTEEEWQAFKRKLASGGRSILTYGIQQAWEKYNWQELPLKSLLPGWSDETRQIWSEALAHVILGAVEEELLSSSGQRLLSKMAGSMIDQAGGFLGAMAAIFMDEEKLIQKITPVLVRTLRGEEAAAKLSDVIKHRLEMYGEKPAGELFEVLTGDDPRVWLEEKLDVLPLESWLTRLEEVSISSLLMPWREQAYAVVPAVTERLLRLIAGAIPKVMATIRLPQLVKEQVEKFPIERLEEVILSVSGKEFRAITWLGVLLGGLIGLIQAIMLLWIGVQ